MRRADLPRRLVSRLVRRGTVAIGLAIALLLGLGGAAWAYIGATGTGTGTASVAFPAPTNLHETATSVTPKTISWTSTDASGTHYSLYYKSATTYLRVPTTYGCYNVTTASCTMPKTALTNTFKVRAFTNSTNPTVGLHATSATAHLLS